MTWMAVFGGAVGGCWWWVFSGTYFCLKSMSCHYQDQNWSAEQPGFLWCPLVSGIKPVELPRRKVSSKKKNLNRKSLFYVTCPDIVSATSSRAGQTPEARAAVTVAVTPGCPLPLPGSDRASSRQVPGEVAGG